MKNGKKLNMNRWTFKSKQSVILKIILKCNNQSLLSLMVHTCILMCLMVHTCILIPGESTRELEVQGQPELHGPCLKTYSHLHLFYTGQQCLGKHMQS